LKPVVSIVVVTYDQRDFVREAVESCLAQDFQSLQIVISDDGSTDGSAGIARSFGAVRYLYQENLGPAAARNTGIAP